MGRLIWIRHGETVWNIENRCQGVSDIPLTDRGKAQASSIGEALKKEKLAAVYASPLSRAMETAQAVGIAHGLQVEAHPGLKELNQGILEGLNYEELKRDHAELTARWYQDSELIIPQGESMAGLQKRAWAAMEWIVGRHPEETVAVVSHNLTILSVVCKAIGLPLVEFRRLRLEVASLTILDLFPAAQPTDGILTIQPEEVLLKGFNIACMI